METNFNIPYQFQYSCCRLLPPFGGEESSLTLIALVLSKGELMISKFILIDEGIQHYIETSTKYKKDTPILIVSICMGKSIRIQRANIGPRP